MALTSKDADMLERMARVETILEGVAKTLEERKDCDEKIQEKLDKLLSNDSSKLERIAKLEVSVKNLKMWLWAIIGPIIAGVARWFAP